jgi:hypothetical protein
VDVGPIKGPLASDNSFFRLNPLLNGKVPQRTGNIVHDCFFSTNKPAISVDNNDVLGHELSQLFDVSSLNGCRPPNGDTLDLLNFFTGRSGHQASPAKPS